MREGERTAKPATQPSLLWMDGWGLGGRARAVAGDMGAGCGLNRFALARYLQRYGRGAVSRAGNRGWRGETMGGVPPGEGPHWFTLESEPDAFPERVPPLRSGYNPRGEGL